MAGRPGEGAGETHHEKSVVRAGTNYSDFNAVLRVPLANQRSGQTLCGRETWLTGTHASVAVENVDIFSCVEVVDGTFAVDLKGVCERALSRHVVLRTDENGDLRSSILMFTEPHQISSLEVSS